MKLKSLLPAKLYSRLIRPLQYNYLDRLGRSVYSQEGEDLLIEKYLGAEDKGFYIDIGAHHPFRFSNTYYFYKKGWSGINIEPNPAFYASFIKYRPRDINLNIGIGERSQQLLYYSFEEPAFNTFVPDIAEKLISQHTILLHKQPLEVARLSDVLSKLSLPDSIDFMNIDTEGMDLQILKTNDWDRVRPKLILAESKVNTLQDALSSELSQYLALYEYQLVAKLHNTTIFKRSD